MLLKNEVLEKIIEGKISLVFRRWKRPTVKTGGTLKTRKGVLSIKSVETVKESSITAADAKKAGFKSVVELAASLSDRPGEVYKVAVNYAGEDPRVALRKDTKLTQAELEGIRQKLERWDQSKVFGKWTLKYLQMIHDQPNTHAQILADSVGLAKNRFKANVRKLKELGLTESLRPGYKLSPRGEKVYSSLAKKK
jgi:hypothetical protein